MRDTQEEADDCGKLEDGEDSSFAGGFFTVLKEFVLRNKHNPHVWKSWRGRKVEQLP